MATMHGAASFTNSTNMTPGAAAGDGQSPDANPVGSIISQGGEQPDPNLGHGLGEGQLDGGDEGGLDFNDDAALEDGQLAENDELAGLNGELGNLESDFQTGDDIGGDIMNPMEDAEYYQGSFQEDDPHFAEYRSQGSDDEDNIEQL